MTLSPKWRGSIGRRGSSDGGKGTGRIREIRKKWHPFIISLPVMLLPTTDGLRANCLNSLQNGLGPWGPTGLAEEQGEMASLHPTFRSPGQKIPGLYPLCKSKGSPRVNHGIFESRIRSRSKPRLGDLPLRLNCSLRCPRYPALESYHLAGSIVKTNAWAWQQHYTRPDLSVSSYELSDLGQDA